MDPERDLVIVSMHEKGFPHADFYKGCGEMSRDDFNNLGAAPDDFFTMKRGDSLEAAVDRARLRWPTAIIVPGEPDVDPAGRRRRRLIVGYGPLAACTE